VELLQKLESEPNKIVISSQTKDEESNELSVSDLIATLKGVKIEEQELLRQRDHLQTTETELRNQAITEIDEKKQTLKGLKSEIRNQPLTE
jgi:predicted transcriptional regulator